MKAVLIVLRVRGMTALLAAVVEKNTCEGRVQVFIYLDAMELGKK